MTKQIIPQNSDNPAQIIEQLIAAGRLDDALAALDDALRQGASSAALRPSGDDNAPQDSTLLFLRGKVLWRLGRKGEAISAYEAATALDPHGPASIALDQARSIMSFFHHDLLNP